VEATDAAALAALVRKHFSADQLETGVSEPTLVEFKDGSKAFVLPRGQMFEPYRSFRLIDAAAMGSVLVITFGWDDGADDDTVFLLPLDTRDVDLDMSDNIAVSTFLAHHLEFTLGGPRESWAARSIPLSRGLSVVQPFAR
jgi:hypothetical protein